MLAAPEDVACHVQEDGTFYAGGRQAQSASELICWHGPCCYLSTLFYTISLLSPARPPTLVAAMTPSSPSSPVPVAQRPVTIRFTLTAGLAEQIRQEQARSQCQHMPLSAFMAWAAVIEISRRASERDRLKQALAWQQMIRPRHD